ncbi:MAG: flagellar filament capping protein FliD [Succinivibrio sp.]
MSSTTITSSGVGSGNDFESIISASVSAKRQQYEKRTTTRKSEAQIEQQGLNSLKSALKTFKEKCDELTKDNSLNTHAVNTNQSKDYTAFTVKTEDDCANMSFELAVTQLSKAESVSQSFNTADGFQNSFSAGKLTIDLGPEEYEDDNGVTQTRDRVFTVDIYEGDTIELVRKRINQNDFDVNVGLVKTSDGYSFSISSGQTGQGTTNLKITAESNDTEGHDSLSCFNFNPETDTETVDGSKVSNGSSKWNYSEGKDAKILVDGHEVTSHTNNFDDGQISGLSITVNQLSELTTLEDGTTGRKTYTVDVTTDVNAATAKMQTFVDAYNSLMSTMDSLYKRNTYTDGKNNYDGGDLSGDSQLKSLQNEIQNMVVRFTKESTGKSIFDCGIEYKKDGTLSIDSDDFKKNLNENFNSVVSLFTEDDGLIDKLSEYVKEYTQIGGILAERLDSVQNEIDDWTQKEQDNEEKLEKYEANLRTKYGNLDSLMSSYNTSLSYISSILG